ncbi:MAG TPA: hypothetical protein VHJ17_01145 [Thermomonospora sp.]|nr:hypothetical protein [Thermomonospora sp.]
MGVIRRVLVVGVAGALGTVVLAGPADAAALRVSPSSGLDPGGQTVSISGSGFDPARNNGFGVYVVFGPRRADFHRDANAYGAAVWVHRGGSGGGQARMSPSGTFSVTLRVKARYTDGNGRAVDCTATPCYVMAMAAHGVPDRSQDVVVPVTFGGGGTPTPSSPRTSATPTRRATPTGTASVAPQSSPAGTATPLAVQPFRQTAAGPPARSPWPFWLLAGSVAVAVLVSRRLARRR